MLDLPWLQASSWLFEMHFRGKIDQIIDFLFTVFVFEKFAIFPCQNKNIEPRPTRLEETLTHNSLDNMT